MTSPRPFDCRPKVAPFPSWSSQSTQYRRGLRHSDKWQESMPHGSSPKLVDIICARPHHSWRRQILWDSDRLWTCAHGKHSFERSRIRATCTKSELRASRIAPFLEALRQLTPWQGSRPQNNQSYLRKSLWPLLHHFQVNLQDILNDNGRRKPGICCHTQGPYAIKESYCEHSGNVKGLNRITSDRARWSHTSHRGNRLTSVKTVTPPPNSEASLAVICLDTWHLKSMYARGTSPTKRAISASTSF